MKLKGKKSPCWLGPSGSFSGREEKKTEKKISRQDQDLVHSITRTHYAHSSMCSHGHVQPEIKFRGVRQQRSEMTEPSATPQHLYEKHFAPADHLMAFAAADFGNPSVDRPRRAAC